MCRAGVVVRIAVIFILHHTLVKQCLLQLQLQLGQPAGHHHVSHVTSLAVTLHHGLQCRWNGYAESRPV